MSRLQKGDFELWVVSCPSCHASPETLFVMLRSSGRASLVEQDCACELGAAVVRELMRRVAAREIQEAQP